MSEQDQIQIDDKIVCSNNLDSETRDRINQQLKNSYLKHSDQLKDRKHECNVLQQYYQLFWK